MPADDDKVKDVVKDAFQVIAFAQAIAAVKNMQKLNVEKSFVPQYVDNPDNSLLTKEAENAEYNATVYTELAKQLIALYKRIDTSTLVKFSKFWLDEISNLATKHHEMISKLSHLYKHDAIHGEIAKPLRDAHHDFFQVVALKFGAMMMLDNDHEKFKDAAQIFNKEKEKFNALKNSMAEEYESWKRNNLKFKVETEDVLQAAKIASVKVGTATQAGFFAGQADVHKKEQDKWLWGFVGVTVALLVYLIGFDDLPSLSDLWETRNTSQGVSKTLIIPLLLFILFFCAKNYKAHGHNYIVNTHRANSLQTYEAIVKGAHSSDTHDVILEQAAKCIFMPLDTGYIKDMNSTSNPVVETIKNVVKSGNEKG